MVRTSEDAGAAVVHIEDQLLTKCGHLDDKKLASAHDMAAKVAAGRQSAPSSFSDCPYGRRRGRGVGGCGRSRQTLPRSGRRRDLPEALTSGEMFRGFAKALPGWALLANMTEFGKTPFFTASEFEAMGYKMVIWPVSSFRVANKPQEKLYGAIVRDGTTKAMLAEMQTRSELYSTLGLNAYEKLNASIVETPFGGPSPASRRDTHAMILCTTPACRKLRAVALLGAYGTVMIVALHRTAQAETLEAYSTVVSGKTNIIVDIITYISYILGAILAALGIVDLKKHVEQPTQTPLKNGLAKLGFGGVLLGIPFVTGIMQDTMNGSGAAEYKGWTGARPIIGGSGGV